MRYFLLVLSALFMASVTLQSANAQERKVNPFSKKFMKKRLFKKKRTIRGLSFSEYGIEKPNFAVFQKKISKIKDLEVIHLDMTLKNIPGHFPESSPCKGTEWGSIETKASTTIHLLPILKNINLLFEMLPGSREKFPFGSVSCVYNPTTPAITYVRFTGFFVVHHHVIPSAVLHEFRAIAKPSFLK